MGELQTLQAEDQTIEWDPADEQSVHRAHGAFDALKKAGFEFFEAETQTVTTKGGRVSRFKKTLGKIIAVPGTSAPEPKAPKERGMRGGPPRMPVV